jgi:hypothetical protein
MPSMGGGGIGAPGSNRSVGMIGSSRGTVGMSSQAPSIHTSVGIGGKMIDGTDVNAAPFIPAGNTMASNSLGGGGHSNIGHMGAGATPQRAYDTGGLGALNSQRTAGLNPSPVMVGGSMDMTSSMFYNGLQRDPAPGLQRENPSFSSRDEPQSSGMTNRGGYDQGRDRAPQQEGGLSEQRPSGEQRRGKSIGSRVNERMAAQAQQHARAQHRDDGSMAQQQRYSQQIGGQGSGNDMGGGQSSGRPIKSSELLSPSKLHNASAAYKQNPQYDRRGGSYNSVQGSTQASSRDRYASNNNNAPATGKYEREDKDGFRKVKAGSMSKQNREKV